MDELLIEDKKYVSSKRAAKMTGYAKDYIGQLCREGRVPARLVGRSWYVLETAIQDHRFGVTDVQPEESEKTPPEPVIPPKWESPRYESVQDELLPSVNRLRDTETGVSAENSDEAKESEDLQDTWKTWFDRIADADTVPTTSSEVLPEAPVTPAGTQKIVENEANEAEEPVNVPVHAVYRQPPEELLPRRRLLEAEPLNELVEEVQPAIREESGFSRATIAAIQLIGVSIAVVAASLAIAGSGYIDEFIISNSQARIIAGVGLYNK